MHERAALELFEEILVRIIFCFDFHLLFIYAWIIQQKSGNFG